MATQFRTGSDDSLSLKVMTKGHSPTTGLTVILATFFPTPLGPAADTHFYSKVQQGSGFNLWSL